MLIGHENNTAPLISLLQLAETRVLHLEGLTGMVCNLTRPWDSLYVWHSHFNTILSIFVGVLKFKFSFMTYWSILWNIPCEKSRALRWTELQSSDNTQLLYLWATALDPPPSTWNTKTLIFYIDPSPQCQTTAIHSKNKTDIFNSKTVGPILTANNGYF